MQWTKPDFQEITLNMEVTAYVNTDGDVLESAEVRRRPVPAAVTPSTPPAVLPPESRG